MKLDIHVKDWAKTLEYGKPLIIVITNITAISETMKNSLLKYWPLRGLFSLGTVKALQREKSWGVTLCTTRSSPQNREEERVFCQRMGNEKLHGGIIQFPKNEIGCWTKCQYKLLSPCSRGLQMFWKRSQVFSLWFFCKIVMVTYITVNLCQESANFSTK